MKILMMVLSLAFTIELSGQAKELKLNHFYIVVDSMTFKNIKESKELASLVNMDKGLPSFEPIDSSSSTIYVRGKNTYIEIMGPKNKFNEKVGSIGLGFSWDSDSLADTLFESRVRAKHNLAFKNFSVSRKFDEENTPWFKAYYTELEGDIASWYSFYYPIFLTKLNHKKYSSFKRNHYLENAYSEKKAVVNVTKIELNCMQKDYEKIVQELDCFYTKSKQVNGGTTTYQIDDLELKLHLTTDRSTIKGFRLKTKKTVNVNLVFGSLKAKSFEKELIFHLNENDQ